MLSPEVWDFKPPQHCFSREKQRVERNDAPPLVSTHYFNHSVSVVLPDTASIPDGLRNNVSEDSDYYRVNGLNVSDLLDKEFVEAFVKRGELSLLAIGKAIDLENSIAVVPSGILIISLLTKDFQKLGLEGEPSFFDRKVHTRYVVRIDLKSESFAPGKKNYEHARSSLRERLLQRFDVIVAWNPPEERICPSSVAAWFHQHGYATSLCRQSFLQRAEYSLKIPVLSDTSDHQQFIEWLGVLSVSGDLRNEKEDNFVNSYVCPSPSIEVGQVQYLQWTGFFTRKQLERIYNLVKGHVVSRENLPWAALHVQGFADSPVSFDLKEHTVYVDGDNSYTVLFKTNGDSIVRASLSSNNKPRISL